MSRSWAATAPSSRSSTPTRSAGASTPATPTATGCIAKPSGLTAGIGKSQDGGAGHVTFYVHADDPEGTLKRVEQLGGKVIMPLTKVAPETTIALFADPEGHIVGLM